MSGRVFPFLIGMILGLGLEDTIREMVEVEVVGWLIGEGSIYREDVQFIWGFLECEEELDSYPGWMDR